MMRKSYNYEVMLKSIAQITDGVIGLVTLGFVNTLCTMRVLDWTIDRKVADAHA